MYKYTIEIFYSEEDERYIAVVPELPGCSAFGETEEEALKEIKVAIELWIEAAKKEGREFRSRWGKSCLKLLWKSRWFDGCRVYCFQLFFRDQC